MSDIGIDQALVMVGERLRAADMVAVDGLSGEIIRYAASLIPQGRMAEAEDALARLGAVLPTDAACLLYRGICRQLQGDHVAAEALIRRSLILSPDRADAWCNLGVSLLALGDVDQAVDCFRRALRRDSANQHALNNLGAAQLKRGEWDNARDVLDYLVSLTPKAVEPRVNLAMALVRTGNPARAAEQCETVLAVAPDNVDALMCLADARKRLGEGDKALLVMRRAVEVGGGGQALNNLANLLQEDGRLLEAVDIYHAILQHQPDDAAVWSNLGNALAALGREAEAVAAYETSLRRRPDARVHGNLIFARQYQPEATASSLLAEARRWDALYGGAGRPMYLNTPEPDRCLRIGYLSPDFRRHAAGYFVVPMVAAHDRSEVEVHCYHDHPLSDDMTDLARAAADHWHPVADMDDARLVERIMADGIDILVDCAGHSAGGRLLALTRKPAPVQVTTLLGHGGTTGMAAMDAVLADADLCPETAGDEFSEQVLRLPVFAPFRPDPAWPAVLPLPDGPPVLACFGNPARIGGQLIGMWERILDRLPGARLLLKHASLGEPAQDGHWRTRLARLDGRFSLEGVAGGWQAGMEVYGRIALALDTFPAHGASSTLIPLWMGVPVVSLAGDHAGRRFGASILRRAGLGDLVAASPEEYVDKVVELAQNRLRLADLRGDLRSRLADGPACDAAGFARAAEAAYRTLWRRWCAEASR